MAKEELEKLIEPLVSQENAELVDLTFAKEGPRWVLRVFLDKQGGITLDDCGYFSERIGSLIDSSSAIDRAYVLEVSSPGLDRVIKKDKDYERFSGRAVRVRLKAPENGQRNFQGILRGIKDGKVQLEAAGKIFEFPAALVAETRLDYAAEV
jgi:ribosome maturation factor RimP